MNIKQLNEELEQFIDKPYNIDIYDIVDIDYDEETYEQELINTLEFDTYKEALKAYNELKLSDKQFKELQKLVNGTYDVIRSDIEEKLDNLFTC